MDEKVSISLPFSGWKKLSDLGVVLGKDSYKSLLQWAALKSVNANDWAEYDYLEPDLSNPTLDKRTVTLNFHAQGVEGYETFMDFLKTQSHFLWLFHELGMGLGLRVDSNSLKSVNKKWQSFSINFIDDSPYRDKQKPKDFSKFGGGNFSIDSLDIAYFGVWILEGSLQSIRQLGKVKQRLLIAENSQFGAVYDYGGTVKTSSNDFTLKCLIRAENLKDCVRNYYALLEYLIRPNERKIVVKSTLEVLGCYYKNSICNGVFKKLSSGLSGIDFNITFSVTDKGIIKALSDDNAKTVLTDKGAYLVLR